MKPRRQRAPLPAAQYRITFDHRGNKDRPRCGCGWVGAWAKGTRTATEQALRHRLVAHLGSRSA